MHSTLLANVFLGLCLSVAAQPADTKTAPIVGENPPKLFEAKLMDKENTTVRGTVNIWAQQVGVKVHADFWGITPEQSSAYHIHAARVPEDGNCYATGAHLDPYGRGQDPACDASKPETCEVGDLSGKHSPIFSAANQPFEIEYPDFFLSTDPNSPAYFGDLSVVIHGPNESRLNCGNFELVHADNCEK